MIKNIGRFLLAIFAILLLIISVGTGLIVIPFFLFLILIVAEAFKKDAWKDQKEST